MGWVLQKLRLTAQGVLHSPLVFIPMLKPFNAPFGITLRYRKKHFLWLHCLGRATAELRGVTSSSQALCLPLFQGSWQMGWAHVSAASGSAHCLLLTLSCLSIRPMLLTLKATLCSVLASLSGNLTATYPYLSTTAAPWTHPHPQLPVIFPGAMICICHLQGSHLDPQLHPLAPAPLWHLTQSKQMLRTWNDLISFPCALGLPLHLLDVLEYLTPALKRVLWTLEPNFQMCLVDWNILTRCMLGSVLMTLAQSCFAECSPITKLSALSELGSREGT